MAEGIQIEGMVFEASSGGSAPGGAGFAQQTPRERVVSSDLTEDDLALDRSLRPKYLDDYLGQTRVKDSLSILIQAAKQRGECMDHVLFSGPPGLGQNHARHRCRQRVRREHSRHERPRLLHVQAIWRLF